MMKSLVVKYHYFKLWWVLSGKLVNKHLEGLTVTVGKFKQAMSILRIKKADIEKSPGIVNVKADAINFSYTDQKDFEPNTNTNFDCEAMASIGNYLYLFSKDRGDLQTRCYKLPKDTGTYSIAPIATFNTDGKVTDATLIRKKG